MASLDPPKPFGIIYLITCRVSRKRYVGQTTNSLRRRWNEHVNQQGCRLLHRAIQKYGARAFDLKILAQAQDLVGLNKLEAHWVTTLNTLAPNGYNLTEGGGSIGRRSEETRQKMRQLANNRSVSQRAAQSASLKKHVLAQRERGLTNPNAILTVENVHEILRRRNLLGHLIQGIAEDLKVSKATVSSVVKGRSWAHVYSPYRMIQQ